MLPTGAIGNRHSATSTTGGSSVHCSSFNPLSRTITARTGLSVHPHRQLHCLQHQLPVQVPGVRRSMLPPIQAKSGPDRGSVAALEAALGAINNILGTYNRLRPAAKKQQGKPARGEATAGQAAAAAAAAGPSKLISFSAKASSSVAVKEVLTAQVAADASSSRSSSHATSSQNHHSRSHAGNGHKHHNKHSSHSSKPHSHSQSHSSSSKSSSKQQSWLRSLTGKQWSSSGSYQEDQVPPEALARSLQAYLSLPLEQYSVLDPKLITRLPPGADVEATLAELLAEQKARKAQRKASQQQQQQQQQQQPGLNAILESSSTSLEPKMRDLQPQEPANSNGRSSSNASSTSGADASSSSISTSSEAAAAAGGLDGNSSQPAVSIQPAAAPAAVVPVESGGAFLLRIPMRELLGVDLEPLLVVYVDIDAQHAQVKFCTNRLVIGDPRFDQEFKVDLIATMNSKVTQPATRVVVAEEPAATAGGSSAGEQAASTSSSGGAAGSSATSSAAAAEPGSAAAAVAHAEAAGPAAAIPQAPVWQRGSALSCKVKLGMTLRLPHPLSIVPGPLLSTTAGLVAKLVMQALLPSFLELLATDYGRWAAGTSTAARQALPAGSLVAAGKQQLQQLK